MQDDCQVEGMSRRAVNTAGHLDTVLEVGILLETLEDTDLEMPDDMLELPQDIVEMMVDKVLGPVEEDQH